MHRLTPGVLLTALALAGCAGSPLYNEARDKQGQALTKATGQVDLATAVDELDKRFAALRNLEVDTQRARFQTNRDLEIARAASGGPGGQGTLQTQYFATLDRRFGQLVGAPPTSADLDAILRDVAQEEELERQVRSSLRVFNARSLLDVTSCEEARSLSADGQLRPEVLQKVEPDRQRGLDVLYQQLLQHCGRAGLGALVRLTTKGSVLHTLTMERDRAQLEASRHEQEVARHQQQLRVLAAQFQAEVQASTPKAGDATAATKVAQSAEKLGKGIDALRKLAKASDAFAQAEATQRLLALEVVVDAVAAGETDLSALTGEQQRSVAIARLLPTIADDADRLLTQARKPRLGPLLLAKEQQRLAVATFQAQGELIGRQAELRQQRLQAARSEVFAVAKARRALGPPAQGAGVTVRPEESMQQLLADGTAEGARRRAVLLESFAHYFDHAMHHRAQAAALETAANGVQDERVMLQSRGAAAMWTSLLNNMAAIVAEYHAAGIKPAELAELLKGVGLVHIGTQVGR
jgi:hypothetical protein